MLAKHLPFRYSLGLLLIFILFSNPGCDLLSPDKNEAEDVPQMVDYFPLHVGDTWHYDYSWMGGQVTRILMVTDTVVFDGHTYFYYLWDSIPAKYFRVDKIGDVYQYHESFACETLYLDFHAAEGDTYSISNIVVEVISVQAEVETPAGSFTDCIEFSFYEPGIVGGFTQVYAPSVGMVHSFSGNAPGWFVMNLTEATIKGVTYP